MDKLLTSAFAVFVALAMPTALWAADEHNGRAPEAETSHGSMGGPSGQHGSMGGPSGMRNGSMVHTTGAMNGRMHHSYQFNSSTNTRGHLMAGPHPVVDVSRFRRNVTAERHFHWGDYRGPSDYSYHRWSYGDILPAEYWVQDYWINNFLNFGLDVPPDGYVWVRYGPDALLVDEDTGEIIQVEYGVFY